MKLSEKERLARFAVACDVFDKACAEDPAMAQKLVRKTVESARDSGALPKLFTGASLSVRIDQEGTIILCVDVFNHEILEGYFEVGHYEIREDGLKQTFFEFANPTDGAPDSSSKVH